MDKRNDEQEKAGSLPHDTTKCPQHLYKISITITVKSVTENEMDRKKNDKEEADTLFHGTISHTLHLDQISKS